MCKKVIIKKVCPECGAEHSITKDEKHTEVYCKKCGLVISAQYYQQGIIFPGLKTIILKIK